MQPLVSVITPAYNATRYIDETIASVLAQDHPRVEHIIVDDVSTDGTRVRVGQWMTVSNRVRLVSRLKNGGPGPAINSGVGISSGTYLIVLASDDKLIPNYVSTCVDVLQRYSKVGFVYTDTCYFRESEGKFVYIRRQARTWDVEALRQRNIIAVCTLMMRRSVFDAVGGYRDIPHSEDYDFMLACAGLGIVGMPLHNVTTHIRVRPDSRWATASAENILMTDKMLQERHGLDVVPLYERGLHGNS